MQWRRTPRYNCFTVTVIAGVLAETMIIVVDICTGSFITAFPVLYLSFIYSVSLYVICLTCLVLNRIWNVFAVLRFVCGYNSALWRPFTTRLKQRHHDVCREQQSHHHTGERERPILRVQPERRGPGQQGTRCAKCRDAQEGTDNKSSKITKTSSYWMCLHLLGYKILFWNLNICF